MRLRSHRSPFAVKAQASFTHSRRWREDHAYRFREASGVLRLAGAFGPEQNWDHLQTVIHECVCEATAVLSQSKRKQASRTPDAGARIMLTDFAKRLECSGLPALSDRSRIGTICKRSFMNASAKSPQSFRSQSGSKLHALHTLARGSCLQISRSVWSAPACRRFRTGAELGPFANGHS